MMAMYSNPGYTSSFIMCLLKRGISIQLLVLQGLFIDVDLYYRFANDPKSTAGGLAWTQMYTIISCCNSVIANAAKAVPDETVATKYAEAQNTQGICIL